MTVDDTVTIIAHKPALPFSQSAAPNYLSKADYFIRGLEAAGLQLPMQIVWLVDRVVPAEEVTTFAQELSQGSLARKESRYAFPGGPQWWEPVLGKYICEIDTQDKLSTSAEVSTWLLKKASYDFNIRTGKAWRLDAAYTAKDTTVVVLTVYHQLTDGRGMFLALYDAVTHDPHPIPQPQRPTWKDYLNFLQGPGKETLLWRSLRSYLDILKIPFALIPNRRNHKSIPISLTFHSEKESIQQSAIAAGGSVSSILQAITANISQALIGSTPQNELLVMMDTRTEGQNSNQIDFASLNLTGLSRPIDNLAELRKRSKVAYKHPRRKPSRKMIPVLSNVGDIHPVITQAFSGTTVCFAKASPIILGDGFMTQPRGVTVFATGDGNKLLLSFQAAGTVDHAVCTQIIIHECQRFGITLEPLFDYA